MCQYSKRYDIWSAKTEGDFLGDYSLCPAFSVPYVHIIAQVLPSTFNSDDTFTLSVMNLKDHLMKGSL